MKALVPHPTPGLLLANWNNLLQLLGRLYGVMAFLVAEEGGRSENAILCCRRSDRDGRNP